METVERFAMRYGAFCYPSRPSGPDFNSSPSSFFRFVSHHLLVCASLSVSNNSLPARARFLTSSIHVSTLDFAWVI